MCDSVLPTELRVSIINDIKWNVSYIIDLVILDNNISIAGRHSTEFVQNKSDFYVC